MKILPVVVPCWQTDRKTRHDETKSFFATLRTGQRIRIGAAPRKPS